MLGGERAVHVRESDLRDGGFHAAARRRALGSQTMDPEAHAARYRVALHRAKGAWFAFVLDLPGCIGRGATEVEAIENARAVIRSYLQVARLLALDPARIVLEISA